MTFLDDGATENLASDERFNGIVVSLRAMETGAEYPLDPFGRRWTLGSRLECDVVIPDRFISGTHCLIERQPAGALIVRDRNSRNGTEVDGNRVEGAVLRIGSHLRIGRTTLLATGQPGRAASAPVSARAALRGRDPVLLATIDQATRAAQADCNVLIVGETGTGKDLFARLIHEASRRSVAAFVPVNCGAIPRELVGSELFGHEKGAFTGAHSDRDGYFVEASGGTLFLDEIGELPIDMQPHLLRALETKRVRRVGGSTERAVDVRIVAATNRTDGLGTDASHLRADLYHRLATVVIALPPLRDRMGDLVDLVDGMLADLAPDHGERRLSKAAWDALGSHPWPGNVRELRHAVARAVALGGTELGPDDFFATMHFGTRRGTDPDAPDATVLAPYERAARGVMAQALAVHGSIRAAAAHLGMAKSTFADRARMFGLEKRARPRSLLKRVRDC